jgi:hypothetical protein
MKSVNLIPAKHLVARGRRLRARAWGVGLCVYAAALAAACVGAKIVWAGDGGRTASDLETARSATNKANTALAQASKRLADAQRTQKLIKFVRDQPDWSILLALIGKRLGDETVLREVRLEPVKSTPTGSSGSSSAAASASTSTERFTLHLRGFGKTQSSVSAFVSAMEKVELFDHVKLLRTTREPFLNGMAVTFEIECSLGEGTRK